jgi:hypothetical protein
MKTYIDIRTNVGEYVVEINTSERESVRYAVWTDTGEVVDDGVYSQAYDSFQEVAESVVEKYIAEFELVD